MESRHGRPAAARPGRRRSPTCVGLAAERYGDRAGGRATSATASGATSPTASSARSSRRSRRGLIDLGIAARRPRRAARAHARPSGPTRLRASRAPAASSSRSTRPTRRRSASGWPATPSRASIVCEDAEQVAKIDEVRDELPELEHDRSSIDPAGDAADAIPLDELRERGRGARRGRARRARRGRHARGPVHDHLHVRHHRPAQGLRAHARQLPPGRSTCARRSTSLEAGDVVYLYLPLAHAFALLIQLLASTSARTLAYFGGDPKQIVARADGGQARPTCRRSRGSSRRSTRSSPPTATRSRSQARRSVGVKVRALRGAGQAGPAPSCRRAFDKADERAVHATSATSFGGQLEQAITGAAPIAQEILEFFYACGVPVLEGYGHDRDRHGRHDLDGRATTGSARSAARCPGVEVRIADDGEVLHARARTSSAATTSNDDASVRRDRRTAGCTPATSARSTRTATSPSPAARRTSSSPRAARTSRRPTSRTTSSSRAGSRRP